jgi:hypothetical protein
MTPCPDASLLAKIQARPRLSFDFGIGISLDDFFHFETC